MPDYPSLFEKGIYEVQNGIKVFAGTVDDPFWLDLGAAFDSFNFRTQGFVVQGLNSTLKCNSGYFKKYFTRSTVIQTLSWSVV